MITLYTEEEFNSADSRTRLPLKCEVCSKTFYTEKTGIVCVLRSTTGVNARGSTLQYCSAICSGTAKRKRLPVSCVQCNRLFETTKGAISKSRSGRVFCSASCAATYNNTHKTTGTRRSKLEKWLEQALQSLYPSIEIIFNGKDAINSELDIYFPKLRLAFELNGIFHYEPIYGPEKLASIKNNDDRKFQACLEKGIELVIIDTSAMKNFKPKKAQKYLDIIVHIVARKAKNSLPSEH